MLTNIDSHRHPWSVSMSSTSLPTGGMNKKPRRKRACSPENEKGSTPSLPVQKMVQATTSTSTQSGNCRWVSKMCMYFRYPRSTGLPSLSLAGEITSAQSPRAILDLVPGGGARGYTMRYKSGATDIGYINFGVDGVVYGQRGVQVYRAGEAIQHHKTFLVFFILSSMI